MSHSKIDSGLIKKIVWKTLQRLAWPGVILPASYTLQRRQPSRNIAWMFPSIRTNFSWFICRAASGAPNCFLSSRYLTNPVRTPLKVAKKLYPSCHWQSITCNLPKISYEQSIPTRNIVYHVILRTTFTYLWQMSYTPIAMPIGCHATMIRDTANTYKEASTL